MLGARADSVVLHVASPAFDAMVYELLLAMGSGARLVVAEPDAYARAGTGANDCRGRRDARHYDSIGVGHDGARAGAVVGTVCSGGEACPEDLVTTWAPSRDFFNVYGPSEMTSVDRRRRPDVGRRHGDDRPADAGVVGLVLDAGLRPVPVGVVGDPLPRWRPDGAGIPPSPGADRVTFVADPFGTGERLYRRPGGAPSRRAIGVPGPQRFPAEDQRPPDRAGRDRRVLVPPVGGDSLSMGVERPGGHTVLAAYVSPRAEEGDRARRAAGLRA